MANEETNQNPAPKFVKTIEVQTNAKPRPEVKKNLLYPKAGQTAILYKGNKIYFSKEYKVDAVLNTMYDVFIGSSDEVTAKIKELNLVESERIIKTEVRAANEAPKS